MTKGFRFLAIALAAQGIAGAALADHCPRRENAFAGYVIELGSGPRFSVSTDRGAIVQSTLFTGESRVQQAQLFEGYLPLEEASARGVLHLKPVGGLSSFFPVQAGRSVSFEIMPVRNGQAEKTWSVQLSALNETSVEVGHCTYTVWRIARKVTEEGGRVIADVVDYYSADLRFVLGRELRGEDGAVKSVVYKNIRARGRSDLL